MAIIAKDAGSDFTPCPEGQMVCVCVDVIDKGMVETQYGVKHKIRIAFQTAETDPDTNRPFLVSQTFTLSLNEKARLRQFLESWRGKRFTDAEVRNGFDVERLVGANALVQVVHNERAGQVYADIQSIMKAPAGLTPLRPVDYVRVVDRPPRDGQPSGQPTGAPAAQRVAPRAEAPTVVHTMPQPGRVEHVVQAAARMPDPYATTVKTGVPVLDAPYDETSLPF